MTTDTSVIIRVGDAGVERQWRQHAEAAGFDLHVSRYAAYDDGGPDPDAPPPHYFKGGKWSGLFDYFRTRPELLERSRYFWFPDDDIETSGDTIRRFLAVVREKDLKLAQPALTPDSYYAHRITLHNPNFTIRRTNFVELMMPIMHRDVLVQVLPIFEGRHAALGLDLFWHQLTPDPQRNVAIIDATPMRHARPRRKHLNGNLSSMAIDMLQERQRTMEELSIRASTPGVHSAETVGGATLNKGPLLTLALVHGLLCAARRMTRQPLGLSGCYKYLKDQLKAGQPPIAFDSTALQAIQRRSALSARSEMHPIPEPDMRSA